MAFNYQASRATADRLIAQFGRAMTLRVPEKSGPAYDPTVTYSDVAVVGAVMSVIDREIAGSQVRVGDKQIYLAAGDLVDRAVQVADGLVIDGVTHSIIPPVKPLAPAGVVVYYEVFARGPGRAA